MTKPLHDVLLQGCKMGHLDCPLADWPHSVSATPATAMGLQGYGQIRVGGPADFILFRARSLSELLSRPQTDRVGSHFLCHVVLEPLFLHT